MSAAIQIEQPADIGVLELLEALIPLADRKQRRRGLQDNRAIRFIPDEFGSLRGCDRGRNDDRRGARLVCGANCREHGGAGGWSVIDQDDGLVLQLKRI